MSLKKYFISAAAVIASVLATYAVAVSHHPMMPSGPIVDEDGFYIEAGLGYGLSRWNHFWGSAFTPPPLMNGSVTSGGIGGFVGGGDIGYQFNHYFSFELGAWHLPSVTGTAGVALFNNQSLGALKLTNWLLYTVAKISVPLSGSFDVFAKAGLSWRFLHYNGPAVSASFVHQLPLGRGISDHVNAEPVLGAGLQYWIDRSWSLSLQYLYHPANTEEGLQLTAMSRLAPAVHLTLFTVAYKF